MIISLMTGCSQTMDFDKSTKQIPCFATKNIKLSMDDTRETKIDVINCNQIPYKQYCS